MALDLSSKSIGDCSKPPSPTLSMTSDLDASFDNRPMSALSDRDSDAGFTGAAMKPVSGPMPSPLNIKSERISPDVTKPLKMMPMDAMTSMYSQMAASAASMNMPGGGMFNPYGGTSPALPMPGMPGMMDNMLNMSSPIAQYLQQKKRRSESRLNRSDSQHSPGGLDQSLGGMPTPPMSMSPGHHFSDTASATDETPAKRQRTLSGSGSHSDSVEERRDQSYWERRRKNNEAAKRSRDARRNKEEEIALRAAFLEQENLKLRAQVTILKNETTKLHYMLYNRM